MASWTERDLRRQFDRAVKLGWVPYVREAATRYGHAPEDLLAIGSRETNLDPKYLRVTGDGGHGHGLTQIDIGSFPEWCRSDAWHDARQCFLKGADVLAQKRAEITRKVATSELDLRRIALAAYNTGSTNAVKGWTGHGDADHTTTGRDYGRDVMRRSAVFARFLAAPQIHTLSAAGGATAADGPEPAPPSIAVGAGSAGNGIEASATLTAGADSTSTVSADTIGNVTVAATAPLPPVEGGGRNDPPVQVGQPLWRKLLGYATGTGLSWGLLSEGLTGVEPTIRGYVILGFVAIVLLIGLVLAVDHMVTKWLRADPAKINVKAG